MYEKLNVAEMMQQPPAVIVQGEDSMASIMKKFQDTGAWNLPVVGYHNRYVGFVSKSKLLSVYRLQDDRTVFRDDCSDVLYESSCFYRFEMICTGLLAVRCVFCRVF